MWPERMLYEEYSYSTLFMACLLFLPLLVAALVFTLAAKESKE